MSEALALFENLKRNPFADDPNSVPQENPISGGNIQPAGWASSRSGVLTAYARKVAIYQNVEYYLPYVCPTGKEAEVWLQADWNSATVTPPSVVIYDTALYTPYTRTVAIPVGNDTTNMASYNVTPTTVRHNSPPTTSPYGVEDNGFNIDAQGNLKLANWRSMTDITGTNLAAPLNWPAAYTAKCAWHPDGKTLFYTDYTSSTIRASRWSPRTGWTSIATPSTAPITWTNPMAGIAVSPDGSLVAVISQSNYISMYTWNGSSFGSRMLPSTELGQGANTAYGIIFSADGGALMHFASTSPYIEGWPVSGSGFGTKFTGQPTITSPATVRSTLGYYKNNIDRVGPSDWVIVNGYDAGTGNSTIQAFRFNSSGWPSATVRTRNLGTDFGTGNNSSYYCSNPAVTKDGNYIGYFYENTGQTTIYGGIIPWTDAGGYGTAVNLQLTTGASSVEVMDAFWSPRQDYLTCANWSGLVSGRVIRTTDRAGDAAIKHWGTLSDFRVSVNLSAGQGIGVISQKTSSGFYQLLDWYVLEYNLAT